MVLALKQQNEISICCYKTLPRFLAVIWKTAAAKLHLCSSRQVISDRTSVKAEHHSPGPIHQGCGVKGAGQVPRGLSIITQAGIGKGKEGPLSTAIHTLGLWGTHASDDHPSHLHVLQRRRGIGLRPSLACRERAATCNQNIELNSNIR